MRFDWVAALRALRSSPPRPGSAMGNAALVRPDLPLWLRAPLYLLIVLFVNAAIRELGIQAFSIPSESMEPTAHAGDFVVVDRWSTRFGAAPGRDEVIVFSDPGGWLDPAHAPAGKPSAVLAVLGSLAIVPDPATQQFVKRVIGVGGDRVRCESSNGPVIRNDVELDESSYLRSGAAPCANGPFDVTVPPGTLFVLGDNRVASRDSAYHVAHLSSGPAFVPVGNVSGRVITVIALPG